MSQQHTWTVEQADGETHKLVADVAGRLQKAMSTTVRFEEAQRVLDRINPNYILPPELMNSQAPAAQPAAAAVAAPPPEGAAGKPGPNYCRFVNPKTGKRCAHKVSVAQALCSTHSGRR